MSLGRTWRRGVDAVRRRRWLVSAVWAVVPMLAGWWWVGAEEDRQALSGRPASGADRVSAVPSADAAGSAPAASAAAPASTVAAAPAASTALASRAGYWDLCGIGRLPWPAGTSANPGLPAHLGDAPLQQARLRLLDALASGDERARAAGAAVQAVGMRTPDALARLVEAGRMTRDPAVASWVAVSCTTLRAPCAAAAARHWSAVEPANAAAWALLRQQEREPKPDIRAALQAADRWWSHWGALPQVVARHLPADVPGYLQAELLTQAVGMDQHQAVVLAQASTAVCRPPGTPASAPPPPPGSDRQQACDRVARLLVERSDTLLAYTTAFHAATLAGWPAQALQPLRDERKQWQQWLMQQPGDAAAGQPHSCAALKSLQQSIEEGARAGEIAPLRARIAAASAPAR